jgi:glycosyltransferase involved in cell wall biosynthesis
MSLINASVVIPTHRSDTSSLRRLILTVDMFLTAGFEVVISDNSGSDDKHKRLVNEFGSTIVFANTEIECNSSENFLAGFNAASCEYVLFATDDDTYFPVGIKALATAIGGTIGYHGFCAPTVRYAPNGTSVAGTPGLGILDYSERLLQWINCDIAVNYYGCYSKSIWQRFFSFLNGHPLKFPFHDQLLRFIVADSGNINCLATAWFAYDYSNWSDSQYCHNSLNTHYKTAGLDERAIFIHPLLEGIEGALCQFKLDELAGREHQLANVNLWWSVWISSYRQLIAGNMATMDATLWSQLQALHTYINLPSEPNIYQILTLICEFMSEVYGSDFGLQDFWLNKAAKCLGTA